MSTAKHKLTKDELQRAFASGIGAQVPVILSPAQLATIIGISRKTVYEWLSKGRLDGTYRKRGKHVLLWRDRALERIMNGKEWSDDQAP